MMALYYISLALTVFFYAVAGIVVLLAVVTAVGCLVSETGRKLAERSGRQGGQARRKRKIKEQS